MEDAQVAAAHLPELALGSQTGVAQDPVHGDVVARAGVGRIAAQDAAEAAPGDQVTGGGESGLIAGAVPADVRHVELAFMPKDEGTIDAAVIEGIGRRVRAQDELAVFVRRQVGLDIGHRQREGGREELPP